MSSLQAASTMRHCWTTQYWTDPWATYQILLPPTFPCFKKASVPSWLQLEQLLQPRKWKHRWTCQRILHHLPVLPTPHFLSGYHIILEIVLDLMVASGVHHSNRVFLQANHATMARRTLLERAPPGMFQSLARSQRHVPRPSHQIISNARWMRSWCGLVMRGARFSRLIRICTTATFPRFLVTENITLECNNKPFQGLVGKGWAILRSSRIMRNSQDWASCTWSSTRITVTDLVRRELVSLMGRRSGWMSTRPSWRPRRNLCGETKVSTNQQ